MSTQQQQREMELRAEEEANVLVLCYRYGFLFIEQIVIMSQKHVSQKARKGRQFLKDTFMIQFFVLSFFAYILQSASQQTLYPAVYRRFYVPELSDSGDGIFNPGARGHDSDSIISKRLYYSPKDHHGVKLLVKALTKQFPDVEAYGFKDQDEVNSQYEENLFDTWAALEFDLDGDQKNSGDLITSQSEETKVKYTIYMTPTNWQQTLSTSNDDTAVYNDQGCNADFYWSSGYITLQNFIGAYLAQQYDGVDSDYQVRTQVQRYPRSDVYEDNEDFSMVQVRYDYWRWTGGTILSICVFIPMLSLLTEIVRERQYKMKDLLEISGLMNSSYWASYLCMILLLCQLSIWSSVGLLTAYNVLTDVRVLPYVAALTAYSAAAAAFGMLFGFVVFRCEYFALPVFMVNSALTVCGAYLGIAYNIDAGLKLFFCFLSPSIALTQAVLTIETYLKHHSDDNGMDANFVDSERQYPSLNAVNGVMVGSFCLYFIIVLLMPFDFFFKSAAKSAADALVAGRIDDIRYPCDTEEEEGDAATIAATTTTTTTTAAALVQQQPLLQVSGLSHVYPDGTHAVKDVSFAVKEGEVLSFLGANGAGKSTCMGMLCGTLDATFGDASVNGFSISAQRTLARRNLGIAMQQDIIWEDVNVEDHLMLFGRLRGLHGRQLREDVDNMLTSLGFPDKRKALAGTLSGGQKRRLCVGLSMVGGNAVVYLDEPTAGLDPVSRRQLWELVQRNRAGRAILLTTHFMDEADVLGDRIAVVKEGRLRALGTAKFLKQRFGLGYLLRMSLRTDTDNSNNGNNGCSSGASNGGNSGNNHNNHNNNNHNNNSNSDSNNDDERVQRVLRRVQEFVSGAVLSSNAGSELSLRLPTAAVPVFADLFEALEAESDALGMDSYGIETTTLEEVFMRIVNEDNEQLLQNHAEANRLLGASQEERDENNRKIRARDDLRHPLGPEAINAILTQGHVSNSTNSTNKDASGSNNNNSSSNGSVMELLPQVQVMLRKRFFQFTRSKGQWTMGFLIPLVLSLLIGVLLQTMPTDLLHSQPSSSEPKYDSNIFATLISAANETLAATYFAAGFGSSSEYIFVPGENVKSLSEYVQQITDDEGEPSTTAIYYSSDKINDFALLYNATYPANFGAAAVNALQAAISDETGGLLDLDTKFAALPNNRLGNQLNAGFFVAMLISLFGGSLGAGMSIVLSGERVSQVKHQQLASGASSVAYWLANFLFDFSLMFLLVLLFAIVFAIFVPNAYTGDGFAAVVGAGFFFAIAAVFRFYSFSYFIEDVRLAQSIYFYGSLCLVFVLIDIWFNVLFISANANAADPAIVSLGMIFTILDPTFGFYIVILYANNFLGVLTQSSSSGSGVIGSSNSPGAPYFYMLLLAAALYAAVFILLTEQAIVGCFHAVLRCCCSTRQLQLAGVATNSNSTSNSTSGGVAVKSPMLTASDSVSADLVLEAPKPRLSQRQNNSINNNSSGNSNSNSSGYVVDRDVQLERERVQRIVDSGVVNPAAAHAIFISQLRKVYYARGSVPAKVAVKGVSVAIPRGEVFGLLGANGAGKTTLLKMVSGQECPTAGFALINGFDVQRETSSAQRSMGLCPQFDTLIERLSVRENLLFFGRIKGLPERDGVLAAVAEAFMQAMNIKRYEKKLIQQLSGGNRRKVSLAVALMGAPPTVYLDEPSTGLDPVASRLMWRLLSRIAALKCTAVVLTTHNMLECEAVCTRVCIMKQGEMVCLGDTQHLRSTHGTGFLLEVNLSDTSHADDLKQFVSRTFPNAAVVDEQATMINFEIPRQSISRLSHAFRILEQLRNNNSSNSGNGSNSSDAELGIVDYALSQSTLEQVFLKQIRPSDSDALHQQDQQQQQQRVPHLRDYITGYFVWMLALLLPGLHHFYFGNYWRGLKYLFTFNEVVAGWLLDLFELHVLIQQSVQQRGNIPGMCFCNCCFCCCNICCCCCCGFRCCHPPRPADTTTAADDGDETDAEEATTAAAAASSAV